MWDLIYSRQLSKHGLSEENFFNSQEEKEKEIYTCMKNILNKYINNYWEMNISGKKEKKYTDDKMEETLQSVDLISAKGPFEKIVDHLEGLNIENDERYVYCFFKIVRHLFQKTKTDRETGASMISHSLSGDRMSTIKTTVH